MTVLTPDRKKVVKVARNLIAREENFTVGSLARDKEGFHVCWHESHAASFSAYGALLRAARDDYYCLPVIAYEIANEIAQTLIGGRAALQEFGDANGYIAVLALFDKALAE